MGSIFTVNRDRAMPSLKPVRRIIQIDLNPEIPGSNLWNTLSLTGAARPVIEDLKVRIQSNTPRRKEAAGKMKTQPLAREVNRSVYTK